MRIALIQQHVGTDREDNLTGALVAMGEARRQGADICAFAELAIDRFFPAERGCSWAAGVAERIPGPSADVIAARARDLNLVTVFNQYEKAEDGRMFDSSPVFDSDGALLGVTRMIHITDYDMFHEQEYYAPGDHGAPVYDTSAGRIGVAICYDRHYPEYMRALGVAGAELVIIPQAGTVGEWPSGMYEAEVCTAAFQNGYFVALCNRVGIEGELTFAGDSFVSDTEGRVLVRGPSGEDAIIMCDVDLAECANSTARRLFWRDRRPDLYGSWLGDSSQGR